VRILVTGGTGQLGRALVRLAPPQHRVVALGSAMLDVTDFASVHRRLTSEAPDLVIHAGAMTDVDGCERDPERAYRLNALGTQFLAAAAAAAGASLLYVSTNYVFDGEAADPYHEFARPAPISVYGASKLAGEDAVRALVPRHYVVRTAMVYDESGRNFVTTMLRLAETRAALTVVADQRGNPTYAGDLAQAIYQVVESPAYGTYHLVNEGIASWYDWAVELFRLSGRQVAVEPIPGSAWRRDARPPSNGALASLAAPALGIRLPPWQDALRRCLDRRGGAA